MVKGTFHFSGHQALKEDIHLDEKKNKSET